VAELDWATLRDHSRGAISKHQAFRFDLHHAKASGRKEATMTFGILYPGDMGSEICRALCASGTRVVTTLQDRSVRTQKLCQIADFEILSTTRAVVAESDIIVSVVPPTAAVGVANDCASLARDLRRKPLYLDVNSISPARARRIRSILSGSLIEMVDGSIHGPSQRLTSGCLLFLSGPRAGHVAGLLDRTSIDVRVAGKEVGTASQLKLLLSGVSKGLTALFLELCHAAKAADLLDEFLDSAREFYPELLSVVDRLLPSYPLHAPRRADEMRELAQSLKALKTRHGLVREVALLLDDLGDVHADEEDELRDAHRGHLEALLERLQAADTAEADRVIPEAPAARLRSPAADSPPETE
jgi:3-hydroxyisobutyrate dehydrogenase-like beta-hydroxyacid dehydrogenase